MPILGALAVANDDFITGEIDVRKPVP